VRQLYKIKDIVEYCYTNDILLETVSNLKTLIKALKKRIYAKSQWAKRTVDSGSKGDIGTVLGAFLGTYSVSGKIDGDVHKASDKVVDSINEVNREIRLIR